MLQLKTSMFFKLFKKMCFFLNCLFYSRLTRRIESASSIVHLLITAQTGLIEFWLSRLARLPWLMFSLFFHLLPANFNKIEHYWANTSLINTFKLFISLLITLKHFNFAIICEPSKNLQLEFEH